MPSPTLDNIFGVASKLVVGVGGFAVSNNQGIVLTTYSLGSCIGVTVYDPVSRAGGMLHAMLPDSSINRPKAAQQPAMFIDTGIAALFHAVGELKVDRRRMQICVAGGAQFLDQSGFFNIGQRNFASLRQLFDQHRLAIDAQDVGGVVSRTIHLHLNNGEVRMRSSQNTQEVVLLKAYGGIG